MTRVRVLHLVDRIDELAGGGERAAAGLAMALPADRYDRWLATTRLAGGEPLAALVAAGVHHVHLDRTGRVGAGGIARLIGLIRRLRPDVLHAHMFGSNVWGATLGRALRVPVVVAHEQTWSYEGQPVRRLLDGQLIGRLAHAVLAVSSADAERMVAIEGVPREKVHVVPNAWFARAPSTGDVRAELGLGPDVPVAACAIVFRPQKRVDVLFEAFAACRARLPDAHLVIAGDGPERPLVERKLREHGFGDAVRLLGVRHDVDALWRAADAVVMSSDFEGTPLAVLEAMAAGGPVVATDVGGLPDITDAACARLVPRRDPAALGAALADVLGDRALRDRMGEAARAKAAEFTAERNAERVAAIYEALLA